MAAPRVRGPYTVVVRFRAPVRQKWLDELANIGCESLAAIGSSTLVVNCPNKPILAKVQKLESVDRVNSYVLTIHISPWALSKLGAKADEGSIVDATAGLAGQVRDFGPRLKPRLGHAYSSAPRCSQPNQSRKQ